MRIYANGLSQIQWVIAWSAINYFREVCFVHRSRYVCVHAQGKAGDLIICYSSSSTPTTTVLTASKQCFCLDTEKYYALITAPLNKIKTHNSIKQKHTIR